MSKTFLFQYLEFETIHSGTLTANRVIAGQNAEGTGQYKPTKFYVYKPLQLLPEILYNIYVTFFTIVIQEEENHLVEMQLPLNPPTEDIWLDKGKWSSSRNFMIFLVRLFA